MEQKAEELYEDGWCTFQTTFFSEDKWVFMVYSIQKPVMFWK